MVVIRFLSWWFTSGWKVFVRKFRGIFLNLADFFSISSLLRTLFQPYRQISAGEPSSGSSMSLRFQAFIDRSISRLVGFVSRFILILVGFILMVISAVSGAALIVIWPLVPFIPVVGIVLTIMGVKI